MVTENFWTQISCFLREAAAEREWTEMKGEGSKISKRVKGLETQGKAKARRSTLGDLILLSSTCEGKKQIHRGNHSAIVVQL